MERLADKMLKGTTRSGHRREHTWMNPECRHAYPALIDKFAMSNEWHCRIEGEFMAANVMSTVEQSGEMIHAQIEQT